MAQGASITVEQRKTSHRIPLVTYYVVQQTVNTTRHEIGAQLTKADVDALIELDIKVTIKGE